MPTKSDSEFLAALIKSSPELQRSFKRIAVQITALFKTFEGIAERVGKSFNQFFAQFRVTQEVLRDRMRAGRGEGDERGWQSYMCAAWLHESCFEPRVTQCDCTCHGGHLK